MDVLLTGATGFVGMEVLERFLERTASPYAVRIALPDGRRVLRVTRSRKVTFRGAPRDGRVKVTVAARNRAGRAGPASRGVR